MFWVQYTLILFTVLAAVLLPCLSVQKAVIIEDPCTDGQRYTLGRDGLIVIKADGNKFFTGSCVVTLRAEDPRYQCSKLCFTVDTFKLQVCDLRLAFYDTGVWNYGSSPAAWVGGCGPNQNIQNKKWCSSGSTATIRLENMRGFAVSMVQKYSFYMTAVSICSEDARIPQEQVSEPAFGGSVSVTVIIIIAVLGCVTICTCVVVIFLVWYVKRRTAMERQGTNDYRNHTIHIPESGSDNYHPVQATDNGCHGDEETSDLMKESTQNNRIWQEPSAPPQEGEGEGPQNQRPPSYCSTPPEYRPFLLSNEQASSNGENI
ncbi:uncharacterized protein LOC125646770 isoform X2 [Ostrea edulis]|uniref:uncharacterized protein LOC125646770 isoform X2 n=1 Tax=Ostrea edulis TaxID=37623 RepID=UPI002094B4A0|nr:uncharacterized protein LOC125646770 isoform X2 [Ostrea edulis]